MSSNEAPPEHMVNFGCGHPQASLLPVEQVAAAASRALLQGGRGSEFLQYGSEIGQPFAREQLAAFLSSEYSFEVSPDTLALTTGVTHGIQLVAQALKRQTTAEPPLCWVEEPTYFLVPNVFQQAGYELETVPTTSEQGLDVASLEPIFQNARETSSTRTLVLYCIPTHHNPLGTSLSEDNRMKLVALCNKYQVYLIADEVYHGLSFGNNDTNAPFFIRSMAMRSPYVVSISAMTKILCPGIRCGWIHATPQMISLVQTDAVNESQGCACQLSSGIVAEMVASQQITPILTTLRQELSQRCQHLCNLLLQQPLQSSSSCNNIKFQLHTPQGGYFVWVELQGAEFDVDEEFRLWCRQEFDVDFKTGDMCSSVSWNNGDGDAIVGEKKYPRCLRLCFAYYDIPKLTEGVERLCRAIEAYNNNNKVRSSLSDDNNGG